MSDAVAQQDVAGQPPRGPGRPSIIADEVHHTYVIHDDSQRPTLRRLVARRFRPRAARRVHAVQGVTFRVAEGEALGIIGRNGSGKSTLLRVVAGLLPAEQGAVYARSKPILLGVAAALHPQVSGRRNVFLGGTALGMSRSELEKRFDDIVDFAGVREFIDMPFRAYSSGMQARLQFAIATAVIPDILLIDEALSVGDEEFKRKSEERMKEMLGEAGSIILVSHSMGAINEICDRVLWMDAGEIRAEGEPAEVIEMYKESSGTAQR